MKLVRCKKLGGQEIPRSCHVLNGRKNYCKYFNFTYKNFKEINDEDFKHFLIYGLNIDNKFAKKSKMIIEEEDSYNNWKKFNNY